MGPVSAETAIDAPRATVYEYLLDLANRPAFMDHAIDEVHMLRVETSGVGAGARFRWKAGSRHWVDTAVEAVEPPHRISERGHGGRLNKDLVATEWELLEGPGSLTTVRVTYWTEPAGPMARAAEKLGKGPRWYRRHLERSLTRLREILEGDAQPGDRARVAGGNRYATGVP